MNRNEVSQIGEGSVPRMAEFTHAQIGVWQHGQLIDWTQGNEVKA